MRDVLINQTSGTEWLVFLPSANPDEPLPAAISGGTVTRNAFELASRIARGGVLAENEVAEVYRAEHASDVDVVVRKIRPLAFGRESFYPSRVCRPAACTWVV